MKSPNNESWDSKFRQEFDELWGKVNHCLHGHHQPVIMLVVMQVLANMLAGTNRFTREKLVVELGTVLRVLVEEFENEKTENGSLH